jgi:mRNA-degrading endonuclease RelE of RelBE toxin-antitoxin system
MRRLDRSLRERIHSAVNRYASEGYGDVKRLKGSDEYRLRVGDWRVRFALDVGERKMSILRVLPRGGAYR